MKKEMVCLVGILGACVAVSAFGKMYLGKKVTETFVANPNAQAKKSISKQNHKSERTFNEIIDITDLQEP